MKGLYFKIVLPNVTSLPYYSNVYYTNDSNYTGSPVTIRANAGAGVDITTPFIREGFQVDSFSQAMGVNSYEPGGCNITFDNTAGNWQTVVNGASLFGCYVYAYCLEANGEIYTDNRLGTFTIKNFTFPSPLRFGLELTDDSPDRNGNGMPQLTEDGDYPYSTLYDICLNKYINIGFGEFSGLSMAASLGGVAWGGRVTGLNNGDAVTPCDYFCTFSPATENIDINRVWVGGVEQTTPGLWEVVQIEKNFPTGQEGREVYVLWNTGVPADEITFEANYETHFTTAQMVAALLGIMGGFEAMDPTSTKNAAFTTEMRRRYLDNASYSNLKVSYQEKKSPGDLLTEFCQSIGLCKWRVNRKRQVELIALTPGNVTVDYTLGQADILDYKLKTNESEIENYMNYSYGYIPQSGTSMFSGAFPGWNKKRSQVLYKKRQSSGDKLLRWIYSDSQAQTVSKFDAIDKCFPRIEITAVLNDETVNPLLLPGDVMLAKHPDALDKGVGYRYYRIERLSRDMVDGGIQCDMIDITHIANMIYTRKLSIQPQATGQTFYDNSITCYNPSWPIENAGTNKMEIKADTMALSGYSWRANSSGDARLHWNTAGTSFGDILNFTNYTVSFRVKMTNLAVEQCFFCISRQSTQIDFWRIGFNQTNKTIFFGLTVNDVSQFTFNTATNTINDITTWHHVVLQKRGTAIEVYVDGIYKGGTTTAATNTMKWDTYVGIRYKSTPTYTLPFLGYMEELHVSHEANPWNCNGSTCTVQTAPVTWFGINNAWPWYGTPS